MKPIHLAPPRKPPQSIKWLFGLLFLALVFTGYLGYQWWGRGGQRTAAVWNWLRDPDLNSDLMMQAGERCGNAPFSFPTDGLVGFIWGDSFRPGHTHQGIDVFGGAGLGVTPIIAAYPGYLTRQDNWKSSVIVRIPSDPLNPGQQIWIYYTHMADERGNSFISAEFPPGTMEAFIEEGTFLGYQGNYSGDPDNPTGIHLHFSIVKDDPRGAFLNELEFDNTFDPSPYLGLRLNAWENTDAIPYCEGE